MSEPDSGTPNPQSNNEGEGATEVNDTPETQGTQEAKEAIDVLGDGSPQENQNDAPESYTDFTVPEGIIFDGEQLDNFK